jgi:hypothetical protein
MNNNPNNKPAPLVLDSNSIVFNFEQQAFHFKKELVEHCDYIDYIYPKDLIVDFHKSIQKSLNILNLAVSEVPYADNQKVIKFALQPALVHNAITKEQGDNAAITFVELLKERLEDKQQREQDAADSN